MQEIEKMNKEKRQLQRTHNNEMAAKKTKINEVLTEMENIKTDLQLTQKDKNKVQQEKDLLEQEMTKIKFQL